MLPPGEEDPFMKMARLGGLVLLVALFAASPSAAVSCKQWERMGPDQKAATLDRMITSAVTGSGGRQYQVDRGAVGRCLEGHARSIQYDIDGACSDSRTASMQAPNKIFKDYIWNCAG
jgi:hypothetical protein